MGSISPKNPNNFMTVDCENELHPAECGTGNDEEIRFCRVRAAFQTDNAQHKAERPLEKSDGNN
jgi:hypothetical protein